MAKAASAQSETPPPKPGVRIEERRAMRWSFWVIGGFALLVVAWLVADRVSLHRLTATRAELARLGYLDKSALPVIALAAEEDAGLTKLNDAWNPEDSSPTLVARLEDVLRIGRASDESDPPQISTRAVEIAQLRALTAEPDVAESYARVHSAIETSPFFFEEVVLDGPWRGSPDAGRIGESAEMLYYRARTMLQDPSTCALVWRDLDACLTLAAHAGEASTFLGNSAGEACVGLARSAMLEALALQCIPPDENARITRWVEHTRSHDQWLRRALRTELTRADAEMQKRLHSLWPWIGVHYAEAWLPSWAPWRGPMIIRCSSFLNVLCRPAGRNALAQVYRRYLAAATAAEVHGPGADAAALRTVRESPRARHTTTPFGEVSVPNSWLVIGDLTQRTLNRLTIVALAAARWKTNHGSWPASVADLELPADITTDPCSGLPIALLVQDGTLIVYAAGLNERDDGGAPPEKSDTLGATGDIRVSIGPGTE